MVEKNSQDLTKKIAVRNYLPQDLDQCRQLWVELTEYHRKIYNDLKIGGDDPGKQFDEHLEHVGPKNLWVASLAGQIVGLAGLIRTDRSGEVEPVIVKTNRRNAGVGNRLIKTILEVARKENLQELTVRPVARNMEAIGFFRKLGFDTIGHVQLIMDLRDNNYLWKAGLNVHGNEFKF